MRLKGINPFEQHVEKIVAGVFALALVGVLAWQFLTPSSKVKVGTEDVAPPDAYQRVADTAKRVDDRIKRPTVTDLPEHPDQVTSRFEQFDTTLKAPVAPKPALEAALDSPVGVPGLKSGRDGMVPNSAIAEVTPPAPTHTVAATFLSTIAPSEAADPEVAKILPAAQPFDKASITVEAQWDGTAYRKALESDPDGDAGPIRAIPKGWWESGAQILGVELRRQTLQPDGSWSNEEVVKPMPGRGLLISHLDRMNNAIDLKDAAKFAAEQADAVRRTPYYNSSFGEKWVAPGDRDAQVDRDTDHATQVRQKRSELEREEKNLKDLEDKLSKVGQAPAPSPSGGGGGGGGVIGGGGKGAGGGGGGGRPSGGGGSPSGPNGPRPGDEAQKKQLTAAIQRKQQQIDRIKEALRALGETIAGDPNGNQPQPDPTAKPKTDAPVLDNNAIKVWAHDVFVERGKTYRYQVVLVMTNPYFGHSAAMLPAQADKLAKNGIVRSLPSEWSEPVAVDPETYLFFTAATEDSPEQGRVANARAEVYQFKWGFWRRASASLEPGDKVAADLKVPDLSKVVANPSADPGAAPPIPGAPPGGGRGGKGAGVGTGSITPPTPTANPDSPATPAGTPPPMLTVAVTSDQMLLGVGQGFVRDSSGHSRPAPQVYLREPDGQIKVIIPDAEKQDPAFSRVSRSADKGIKELTPAPDKPKTTTPAAPLPGVPGNIDPHGRGGPGGG